MRSGWARLGRLLLTVLLGGIAGCGGRVGVEIEPDAPQEPDAALECTSGLQALVTGSLNGTPINTLLSLTSAGSGYDGNLWTVVWGFEPLGYAVATGYGA